MHREAHSEGMVGGGGEGEGKEEGEGRGGEERCGYIVSTEEEFYEVHETSASERP